MKQTTTKTYVTDKGRVLIQVTHSVAAVKIADASPEELEELAEACVLAAEELRRREVAHMELETT